jgi:ribose 1,5-bisphosphokinase
MAGRLVLVVGPSGAGKDSLIDQARQRLMGDPRFVFPRRVVTRPAGMPGEDYEAISPEAFEAKRGEGDFALSWRAHGLCYGIPKSIEDDLAAGRCVVVNVSRSVIAQARLLYPVHVALITAPNPVLAERLGQRGRETAQQIEERLSRSQVYRVEGADVTEIVNDGQLELAVREFLKLLA